MDKIKQTAKGLGYDTFDSIGFSSASGVSDPVAGTNIMTTSGSNSVTHVGILGFADATQAQKYADYFNG